MKRNEIERRQRELKRQRKRDETAHKRTVKPVEDKTVGGYIDGLFARFFFGEDRIFNLTDDINVLEILEEIKEHHPDKLETIIRKAVKRTKVRDREDAVARLLELGL